MPIPVDSVVGELLERCSFPPFGRQVTCAVSGGADSSALLVLAVAAGCQVTAVHVDHGIRPDSAGEAAVVEALAERVGAEFRGERVDVPPGPNLEARARDARRSALPPEALTGHTADDRAETLLLNLLRGAGPTGMSGISRGPKRPILDLRRSETEALCRHLALEVVEDPSNRDRAFRRNRIRHEVLPLLGDIGDRDPVPILIRQADLFADVDALLADLASKVDVTSAAALAAAPDVVAGAAVRAWLQVGGVAGGYGVDQATVTRVLEVARIAAVATEVGGGWRVARSGGRLRLEPPDRPGPTKPSSSPPDPPCKDAPHG